MMKVGSGILLIRKLFCPSQSVRKRQKIQTADSDQTVDNTGEPAHTAKEKGNEVQIEKTDQAPVDRTDYGNCK